MKRLTRLLAKLSPTAADDAPKLRTKRRLGRVMGWVLYSRANAVKGVGTALGVLLLTAMFVLTRTVYSFQVDQYDRAAAAAAAPTLTGTLTEQRFDPGFAPTPTPTPSSSSSGGQEKTARAFVAAWSAGSGTANVNAWVTSMRQLATPALLDLFRFTSPANIPKVKVVGVKTVEAAGVMSSLVTTDQGVLKLDLVPAGSGWLVDSVAPVAPGTDNVGP